MSKWINYQLRLRIWRVSSLFDNYLFVQCGMLVINCYVNVDSPWMLIEVALDVAF